MIYALYAMGPNGEFGSAKGLPWGSFPEELEFFYASLDAGKSDVIIVGKRTYETAPKRLRELLEKRRVLVWGRTPPENWYNPRHRHLRYIGKGLKTYLNGSDAVIIGGAALLEEAASQKVIDVYLRSTIEMKLCGNMWDNFPTIKLKHDDLLLWPVDSAVVVHRRGENEKYRFVSEGVYL
ncbi:thymidylate synthase [Bacteriophage Eos]|nr:thymidylate synthase [Bacteriophage Eos]